MKDESKIENFGKIVEPSFVNSYDDYPHFVVDKERIGISYKGAKHPFPKLFNEEQRKKFIYDSGILNEQNRLYPLCFQNLIFFLQTYEGEITKLNKNEIFVFGSNNKGIHGGGAAKTAYEKFGAKMGKASGLYGKSYGIITVSFDKKNDYWKLKKDSLDFIKKEIEIFYNYAKQSESKFIVTDIGCGIAGFEISQIAPLFKDFLFLGNCIFSKKFTQEILISLDKELLSWKKKEN